MPVLMPTAAREWLLGEADKRLVEEALARPNPALILDGQLC
jgi:hypothetical protein